MSSKEFNSIGLIKKNTKLDELIEKADKLDVHPGLLADIYSQMFKITEKFLEIDKRISAIEATHTKKEVLARTNAT